MAIDSRQHGDPVNLTPYVWPTLKMYTTEEERLAWGISEDRSMQINLARFADHKASQLAAAQAERDMLVTAIDAAMCPQCDQTIRSGHSPDCPELRA